MEEKSDIKGTHRTKRSQRMKAIGVLVAFLVVAGIITILTTTHNHKTTPPVKQKRTAEVTITSKGFEPATLVVERGTQITWINEDTALHQVASNPYPDDSGLPSLKSQILNNTQTYTYTANTTGRFGYHDQLKPTINGTIVIQK